MTFRPPPSSSQTQPASAPRLPDSLSWRPGPTLAFLAMLAGLLVVGLVVRGWKSERPAGLPDDPAVADARAMLVDGLTIPSRELALVTAIAGAAREGAGDSLPLDRLAAARGRLREAAARHPGDARLVAAIAHLDLAAGRLELAERAYRSVLRGAPAYGEARLALGVALALQAAQGLEPIRARARRLAAIGQFANIARDDPAWGAAVANRVALLRAVGRGHEAGRVASDAIRDGLAEPWAARVRAAAAESTR